MFYSCFYDYIITLLFVNKIFKFYYTITCLILKRIKKDQELYITPGLLKLMLYLIGSICQISLAYSVTVLSEENFPLCVVFLNPFLV